MTLSVMLIGQLTRTPDLHIGVSHAWPQGRPCTRAFLIVGTDGDTSTVRALAYGDLGRRLAAFAKGETVALSGRARVAYWIKDDRAKGQLEMVVEQLLDPRSGRSWQAAIPTGNAAQHPAFPEAVPGWGIRGLGQMPLWKPAQPAFFTAPKPESDR